MTQQTRRTRLASACFSAAHRSASRAQPTDRRPPRFRLMASACSLLTILLWPALLPTTFAQLSLTEPPEENDSDGSDELPVETGNELRPQRKRLKESTSPRLLDRSSSQNRPELPVRPTAQKKTALSEGNRPEAMRTDRPSMDSAETEESGNSMATQGTSVDDDLEHPRSMTLVMQDPQPSGFFSGPVPRSTEIGEDATLNDLCSVGASCWAVGERGLICTSTDHGLTWTTQFTPMECSLKSVCFLTNRIGWVAGMRSVEGTSEMSSVLLHTRDGGKSWMDLVSTDPPLSDAQAVPAAALPGLLHVRFFGLNEAVAVSPPLTQRAGATVWHSLDGGGSWIPLPTDQPGVIWTTGAFLNPAEGIVIGRQQAYGTVVASQAVVINRPQTTLRQMRGVSLSPDGSGWIVGDGSTVLSTGNSGVTWQTAADQLPRAITELTDLHTVVHQNSTVLLAGNPASILLRSTTAGSEWRVHSLPMSGRIHCMRFVGPDTVLAAGSFGQILRSEDAGASWQCVRSAGFRAGLLNLVTDADRFSMRLLADQSGENGVRSIVLQMSQPMADSVPDTTRDNTVLLDRSHMACVQLGGNEATADWMFPRTKPEHHLSAAQLVREWNRQTDGQLRRLLPLRLARDLRNWKPAVIVIEPTSDDDAVAQLMQEVIRRAIELASFDDDETQGLRQIGLAPWNVARVFTRVASTRQTALSYGDDDLLQNLGTSNGLVCDATRGLFPTAYDSARASGDRAAGSRDGYELVMDDQDLPAVAGLFEQLNSQLLHGALRSVRRRSRDEVEQMTGVLQAAHVQGTALLGHTQLSQSEGSLIAELRGLGGDLPETLALKQLRDLAELNLQQNNMEGYLAVQQEVTRRFPESEDGRRAAEMMYLFYSSAESRHFRVRSGIRPSQTLAIPKVSLESADPFRPVDNALLVQPQLESAASSPFSASANNQMAALMENWDKHAETALRILTTSVAQGTVRREVSPQVQLRFAANQRLQDRTGGFNNALSELSQRNDRFGVFARSEMQMHAATVPGLPVFNLPRQTERPFLDAKFTDSIWEDAEEISLRPAEHSQFSGASEESGAVKGADDSSVHSLAMLAWDEEYLYVAARLERDPSVKSSVQLAAHRSHDAQHGDRDRFELSLDTDRDFSTAFLLCVDESGLTSDRCWLLDRWNPKWYVAVDADESTWRLEAAIPLEELTARPAKPGDLWSIGLRRIQPGVLKHELPPVANSVSTNGTGLIRFIRPKVVSGSRPK